MRHFVIIILFSGFSYSLNAQTASKPSLFLKVGDQLPSISLNKLIDYPKKEINIADFRDKDLLILFFWGSACRPCVEKLPVLDEFQRAFNDRIQILPVTSEPEAMIRGFYSRIKKNKNLILPTAIDPEARIYESIAKDGKLFGGFVWIKEGKLIALTNASGLTSENIRNGLEGKPIDRNLIQAQSLLPRDFTRSLLAPSDGRNDNVLYQSSFYRHRLGLATYLYVKNSTPNDPSCGLRYVNMPLFTMYLRAYDIPSGSLTLVELEEVDCFNPKGSAIDSTNTYCYELISKNKSHEELQAIFRQDLVRAFGYEVTTEMRSVKCLVLRKIGNGPPLSKNKAKKHESSVFHLLLTNIPFTFVSSSLAADLKNSEYPYFIDETGITDRLVDIEIYTDMKNPALVAEALKKYGLELAIEVREMEMYIIK